MFVLFKQSMQSVKYTTNEAIFVYAIIEINKIYNLNTKELS